MLVNNYNTQSELKQWLPLHLNEARMFVNNVDTFPDADVRVWFREGFNKNKKKVWNFP